mgnify:CR=1 FL=1
MTDTPLLLAVLQTASPLNRCPGVSPPGHFVFNVSVYLKDWIGAISQVYFGPYSFSWIVPNVFILEVRGVIIRHYATLVSTFVK